jgi:queuosine precursor transporter
MEQLQSNARSQKQMIRATTYPVVGMLFVAFLLISNTIAVKIVVIAGFVLPAGILTFPVTYLFGDVLTEVYGFYKSRLIIWTGFLCLLLMAGFYLLSVKLTPAPFWDGQQSYARFFQLSPRIAVASLVAYLFGEFLNSIVISRMKIWTKGKHFWMRAIGSTIAGQGVDSLIFNFAAFYGVFATRQVVYIALSGYILKVAYEVLATPLTYFIVRVLKRIEGHDHYDLGIRYNPFGLD